METIKKQTVQEVKKRLPVDAYKRCLVIDSSWIPRAIISTERAFVISYKGNAEVVEEHPESFGLVNPDLDIGKPSIIRVYTYVKKDFHKVPLTRDNVFRRDNYECVYCPPGTSHNRKDLTLDHVHPQSKGGKDSWNNLVTACKSCNHTKADLLVEELGLEHPNPKRPHYLMLLKSTGYVPEEWKPFLFL
jgi:hypothetical protein